jgi:hypothetical protein
MPQLSEWLQIMLAEIARKREEAAQAAEEEQRRAGAPQPTPPTMPKYLSTQA